MNIRYAVIKGLLSKVPVSRDLVNKELKESSYDLRRAEETFNKGDYKWSIVKSYYAMFHCAKALLFARGYREKKHIGVVIFLEDIEKKGRIDSTLVNDYKSVFSARESADYGYTYNKDAAKNVLFIAKEFIKRVKLVL